MVLEARMRAGNIAAAAAAAAQFPIEGRATTTGCRRRGKSDGVWWYAARKNRGLGTAVWLTVYYLGLFIFIFTVYPGYAALMVL